jgi:hypothetical protein
MCGEMEDLLMKEEIALLGEDQFLFSSDYPHGEAREDAAQNLLERLDVTEIRSKKSCRIIRCDFLASPDFPCSGSAQFVAMACCSPLQVISVHKKLAKS